MTTTPAAPDLQQEVQAIADYLALKWTPIAHLEEIVQDIRVCAERAARVLFEDHPVWEVAVAAQDAREAMLVQKYGEGGVTRRYYDAGWELLDHIYRGLKDARSAASDIDGSWDYSRSVGSVLARVTAKHPGLVNARPKGWEELATGYSDFDGQEEYDSRPDRALFKGTNLSGALSGDFVVRTALPYVIYDENCQGRAAHYTLVGAIFSQFMLLAEQRNTQSVCEDLRALAASLPNEHVYDLDFKPSTPVLQALVQSRKPFSTQQEYEEAMAQQAAYAALTEAEKAVKDRETQEMRLEFLTALSQRKARSYATVLAEDAARIAPIRALLKEAIGEGAQGGQGVASDAESSQPEARRERP